MKKGGQKARRMLLVMLLAAALAGERVPALPQRCFVRAVLLDASDSGCQAALLTQTPPAAADSADARENAALVRGSGRTPAEALAAASQKLTGTADYKLCNSVLAGGSRMRRALEEYRSLVEAEGCGRLSARVFCGDTAALLARGEALDAAGLLAALEAAGGEAPRLYSRDPWLLVPLAECGASGCTAGARACLLGSRAEIYLSRAQTQTAYFLLRRKTELTLTAGGESCRVHVFWAAEPCAGGLRLCADGFLCTAAQSGALRGAAQQTLQAELEQLLALAGLLGWDPCGAQAAETLAGQAAPAEDAGASSAAAVRVQVRLWA